MGLLVVLAVLIVMLPIIIIVVGVVSDDIADAVIKVIEAWKRNC